MFDPDKYLADLILNCRSAFGKRLLYVGLQGSWLRGEASENSDIDVMVILDRFSVGDMDTYREILKEIGFYERSCGFICGKDEMKRWNPLEVCQLRHTTKDLVGILTDYLPPATREDEINYVKLSLGNLYHELCHRYIHADRDKNAATFRGTCKNVFFLIQNLHFLESGRFFLRKTDLKEAVTEEDRIVLEMAELPTSMISIRLFLSCLPGVKARLHASTILEENDMNPKALVVIDIQNDITKHYRDIIDRLNAAIEWAAESGMEIVYIRHNNLSAGTRTFKPGTKGAELVPELKIVSDHIFVKTKANALTCEEFSEFIRSKELREFFITGADATACVKSTCFNMTKAGYAVHVISDCVTSYDLKKMPEMLAYYTDKGCEVKNLAVYTGK